MSNDQLPGLFRNRRFQRAVLFLCIALFVVLPLAWVLWFWLSGESDWTLT